MEPAGPGYDSVGSLLNMVILKCIIRKYTSVLWAEPSWSRLLSSGISLEYGNIKMDLKQIYW